MSTFDFRVTSVVFNFTGVFMHFPPYPNSFLHFCLNLTCSNRYDRRDYFPDTVSLTPITAIKQRYITVVRE